MYAIPICVIKDRIYCLDNEYNPIEIESLSDDSLYLVHGVSNETLFFKLSKNNVMDLQFIRHIIETQNRQAEFEIPLLFIDQAEVYKQNIELQFDSEIIRVYLLCLQKLLKYDSIFTLYKKYQQYYVNVIYPILENIEHFNKNKIRLNTGDLLRTTEAFGNKHITFTDGVPYLCVSAEFFNIKSNRISLNTSRFTKEQKQLLLPENDLILEIDSVASEFRLLLFINEELYTHPELNDKKKFWTTISNMFDADMFEDEMKRCIYLMLYGSNRHLIAKECNTVYNKIYDIQEKFRKTFPKSYAFYEIQKSNKYISPESDKLYDFFDREIYCDENYKKLSYFLQSSLSTLFQLVVNKMIKQMAGLKSKILYTIHDSIMIDLCFEEKNQVLSILKENANYNEFQILFRVK